MQWGAFTSHALFCYEACHLNLMNKKTSARSNYPVAARDLHLHSCLYACEVKNHAVKCVLRRTREVCKHTAPSQNCVIISWGEGEMQSIYPANWNRLLQA
jgi:hypothetical protein